MTCLLRASVPIPKLGFGRIRNRRTLATHCFSCRRYGEFRNHDTRPLKHGNVPAIPGTHSPGPILAVRMTSKEETAYRTKSALANDGHEKLSHFHASRAWCRGFEIRHSDDTR